MQEFKNLLYTILKIVGRLKALEGVDTTIVLISLKLKIYVLTENENKEVYCNYDSFISSFCFTI